MSQRTIVEINHDYAHAIQADPHKFMQLFLRALASGDKREWDELRHFGIRKAVQCHHSDERKVVVDGHDYPL